MPLIHWISHFQGQNKNPLKLSHLHQRSYVIIGAKMNTWNTNFIQLYWTLTGDVDNNNTLTSTALFQSSQSTLQLHHSYTDGGGCHAKWSLLSRSSLGSWVCQFANGNKVWEWTPRTSCKLSSVHLTSCMAQIQHQQDIHWPALCMCDCSRIRIP